MGSITVSQMPLTSAQPGRDFYNDDHETTEKQRAACGLTLRERKQITKLCIRTAILNT